MTEPTWRDISDQRDVYSIELFECRWWQWRRYRRALNEWKRLTVEFRRLWDEAAVRGEFAIYNYRIENLYRP